MYYKTALIKFLQKFEEDIIAIMNRMFFKISYLSTLSKTHNIFYKNYVTEGCLRSQLSKIILPTM